MSELTDAITRAGLVPPGPQVHHPRTGRLRVLAEHAGGVTCDVTVIAPALDDLANEPGDARDGEHQSPFRQRSRLLELPRERAVVVSAALRHADHHPAQATLRRLLVELVMSKDVAYPEVDAMRQALLAADPAALAPPPERWRDAVAAYSVAPDRLRSQFSQCKAFKTGSDPCRISFGEGRRGFAATAGHGWVEVEYDQREPALLSPDAFDLFMLVNELIEITRKPAPEAALEAIMQRRRADAAAAIQGWLDPPARLPRLADGLVCFRRAAVTAAADAVAYRHGPAIGDVLPLKSMHEIDDLGWSPPAARLGNTASWRCETAIATLVIDVNQPSADVLVGVGGLLIERPVALGTGGPIAAILALMRAYAQTPAGPDDRNRLASMFARQIKIAAETPATGAVSALDTALDNGTGQGYPRRVRKQVSRALKPALIAYKQPRSWGWRRRRMS